MGSRVFTWPRDVKHDKESEMTRNDDCDELSIISNAMSIAWASAVYIEACGFILSVCGSVFLFVGTAAAAVAKSDLDPSVNISSELGYV